MAHPNRLQNAHILILGGTSGIGLGVASLCLSHSATVQISGRTTTTVDAKTTHLRTLYPQLPADSIKGLPCDLSDVPNLEANLKALLDAATENGSRKLDHIVVTAGDNISMPPVADADVDAALRGFHVRFLTGLMLAKHIASAPGHYMRVGPSSSLTLTSGTNTLKPMRGWSLGAGWGAAVEGLSRGLAVDLAPIRVNVVSPGAINTPLLRGYREKMGEEGEAKLREGTLVNAWGEVEDCAEAYAWFMRDWFVTGVTATTDGGRPLVG